MCIDPSNIYIIFSATTGRSGVFKHVGNSFISNFGSFNIINKEQDGYYVKASKKFSGRFYFFLLKNKILEDRYGIQSYFLCNEDKTLFSYLNRNDRFIACNNLKFISPLIARNGCSSIIASSLVYDGKIDKITDINQNIWQMYEPQVHENIRSIIQHYNSKIYNDYKLIAIVSDPISRFCRYVSWSTSDLLHNYLCIYDRFTKKDVVDEALFLYKYMQTDQVLVCDEHATLQSPIIQMAEKYLNAECTLIPLKKLEESFYDLFSVPLIKNNVSVEGTRFVTENDLSKEQKDAICILAEKDIKFFNRRNLQFE